jgi:ribosomal protein S18 acetylase RimI-like enzyme
MSEIVIREMTRADLGPVGTLAGDLVRLHHHFDARRFFLTEGVEEGYRWYFGKALDEKSRKTVLVVAQVDGAVAGYVYGSLEPRDWAKLLDAHGAIHDVFVSEAHRRKGIAKQLMLEAIKRLRAVGAPRVVLSSATPNTSAQALFASLGFRSTMVEMTYDPPA